jgi:hypothetical protein
VNRTAEPGINTLETEAWPSRVSLTPGAKIIAPESLVNPQKVLVSPLHIKLGLIKQFVKALQRRGNCFK